MLRIPVRARIVPKYSCTRLNSSSSFIRSTFIEYFRDNHRHKVVKSSPVVPLCDPTVPFVNAGMNQFKGVFLGTVQAPCLRAVNSQKCIRVGGKHNDLEVVGTDGHHHTFFEMLGNWSFGDYYKKEACEMAWDLLLGPYRLKPENLVVTYFGGDPIIGMIEDRECRDIWKQIGVKGERLQARDAKENFWEMGLTGPCGPCTEIHHVNPDGSVTEIWNLVFIQCNREANGSVTGLRTHHVDTGLGLERLAALLQGTRSNYDTDLFRPIIQAIEQHSKGVSPYSGRFGEDAALDSAYRRLADHARLVAVCLADGAYPVTNLNLKQIMRKSLKLSADVFRSPGLLGRLYGAVAESLGPTYPELLDKEKEAMVVIEQEEEAYRKLRSELNRKWKGLLKKYPEVEALSDVELPGFAQGYKEFKETMAKQNSPVMPGGLVFKLYDTHGFQENIIERIADLNNLQIDMKTFYKLLTEHKSRHKAALKEQADKRGGTFEKAIENIRKNGTEKTNDHFKYQYSVKDNGLVFEPLRTKVVALLDEELQWIDHAEPMEIRPYYVVTKDTNFYCEEGGQAADTGEIEVNRNLKLLVNSVFKIRDFVFHKGFFEILNHKKNSYVNANSDVTLKVNSERRLKTMRNHTALHLLNAAVRKVLPNSVVCQVGSSVSEKGLVLNLSVYGEKLSPKVVTDAQNLVRQIVASDVPVRTSLLNSVQLSAIKDTVTTVPGETYPEVGLRLVEASGDDLVSRELCCGTHLPCSALVGDFVVTLVKGAGGHAPAIHALTGDDAKEARELFRRAEKLQQVVELVDPERMKREAKDIKSRLSSLAGTGGAAAADHAACLNLLDALLARTEDHVADSGDAALQEIAAAEVAELSRACVAEGRRFVVHFLRCSYLMQRAAGWGRLASGVAVPAVLLGCAAGVIHAAAAVPPAMVTERFTAEKWLGCILPVFGAQMVSPQPGRPADNFAEMTGTKVSLITCEGLVQDAMRAAIRYADAHAPALKTTRTAKSEPDDGDSRQDRRSN